MYLGGGAVYNGYLAEFMDEKTGQLQSIIDSWGKRTVLKKVLGHLNIFTDWSLKLKAIKDLIDARKKPDGDVAEKINWKLNAYRKKK